MSQPKEICLEELDLGSREDVFIRCVALPDAEPGLALDREGAVLWMPEGPAAYGLCVSADGKLVLLRSEGAGPISVERGARSLAAPAGQPVVLLDQDCLCLEGRRLRVHIHGESQGVYAPERLTRSALGRLARAAAVAAGLAIGGASAAAAANAGSSSPGPVMGEPAPIEVRTRPPVVAPPSRMVDCAINRQQESAKGPLTIHATCSSPKGLNKGTSGSLLDKKSNSYIKDGMVRIVSVAGNKIVVEAPKLQKAVQNAKIRFHIYD
ncbi:MAG: hypothetical protein RBU30_18975 [Polyangia bacterium]|nr:hypothetical protein [Polyangia bacterium]